MKTVLIIFITSFVFNKTYSQSENYIIKLMKPDSTKVRFCIKIEGSESDKKLKFLRDSNDHGEVKIKKEELDTLRNKSGLVYEFYDSSFRYGYDFPSEMVEATNLSDLIKDSINYYFVVPSKVE